MPLLIYSTAHIKGKTQDVFYYGRHMGYTTTHFMYAIIMKPMGYM